MLCESQPDAVTTNESGLKFPDYTEASGAAAISPVSQVVAAVCLAAACSR